MDNTHFVEFDKYCNQCKYEKWKGTDEPCNECLRVPVRRNSRRPVKWKEKE